jgi:hypothetical protein
MIENSQYRRQTGLNSEIKRLKQLIKISPVYENYRKLSLTYIEGRLYKKALKVLIHIINSGIVDTSICLDLALVAAYAQSSKHFLKAIRLINLEQIESPDEFYKLIDCYRIYFSKSGFFTARKYPKILKIFRFQVDQLVEVFNSDNTSKFLYSIANRLIIQNNMGSSSATYRPGFYLLEKILSKDPSNVNVIGNYGFHLVRLLMFSKAFSVFSLININENLRFEFIKKLRRLASFSFGNLVFNVLNLVLISLYVPYLVFKLIAIVLIVAESAVLVKLSIGNKKIFSSASCITFYVNFGSICLLLLLGTFLIKHNTVLKNIYQIPLIFIIYFGSSINFKFFLFLKSNVRVFISDLLAI